MIAQSVRIRTGAVRRRTITLFAPPCTHRDSKTKKAGGTESHRLSLLLNENQKRNSAPAEIMLSVSSVLNASYSNRKANLLPMRKAIPAP